MKKLLALALALLAGASQAQTSNVPTTIAWQYNLNETVTPIYCAPGSKISTSARVTATASTTLTAVSGEPFANVAVGAMLHFVDLNGTDFRRAVTVRNSATSVVVSGANLTATSAMIQSDSQNLSCGTTSAFGAFAVDKFNKWGVEIQITQQVNTGGLQFHLQCRNDGDADWTQVYPELTLPTMTLSYTPAITATGRFTLQTESIYSSCRVGMSIVTTDDGNDLTTNAEQVTIKLIGRS